MNEALIVALDTDAHTALSLARTLQGHVRWLKVGMTLFYAEGPEIVGRLREMGFGIFLDLKLYDIPHQVEGAARSAARLGAGILTVHASGGRAMMQAAVSGACEGARECGFDNPDVVAVTVLTSMDAATLASTGVTATPAAQVDTLTRLAREAGVQGVVCSPHEAVAARGILGPERLVVTPGVRPAWSAPADQARFATPAAALGAGASHVVVGRPVTAAEEPLAAAIRIAEEMLDGNE